MKQQLKASLVSTSGVAMGIRWFLVVLAVEFLERLELVNERAVLTLEHHDTHLQTRDVLFFLPSTDTRRLPTNTRGFICSSVFMFQFYFFLC